MAIYTELDPETINKLLNFYALGHLLEYNKMAEGLTNTNYRVKTHSHTVILTLFEQPPSSENLSFYIELMNFLGNNHLPCPRVYTDKLERSIHFIDDKPCLFLENLTGHALTIAQPNHCEAVGEFLGKMHRLTQHLNHRIVNPRGDLWHNDKIERLLEILPVPDALLLQEEMGYQKTLHYHLFPQGIIHADLLMENVLFHADQLHGVIDFYYTCYDNLLLDVGIALNAWCLEENHVYSQAKIDALLAGYEKYRPLTALEKNHLNDARRTAALRFWVSYLLEQHFTAKGTPLKINPDAYKQLLQSLSFIPRI